LILRKKYFYSKKSKKFYSAEQVVLIYNVTNINFPLRGTGLAGAVDNHAVAIAILFDQLANLVLFYD
jgi:hypothetical protein